MSIRKRTWKGPDGEVKEAWIVDYTDQHGSRHIKTFARKKDADHYRAVVSVGVRSGTHTADSISVTVAEAGQLWLASGEAAGLERSTLDYYRQHVELHIVPLIGAVKLSQLTAPMVRQFEDKLRVDGASARRLTGSNSHHAFERGLVAQNVVRSLRSRRSRGKDTHVEKRQRGKLKPGVDIPTPDEVRTFINHLEGRWRPFFLTAIFTGLRASELRGLRWVDVNLKRSEIHVRQRADCYSKIGPPKSEAGERTIPIAPLLANTLQEWMLVCPKGDLGLVFPNGAGGIENLSNILQRGLIPLQIAAGLTTPNGKAKYTGLHAFRHFYASWCINRSIDGGLELPLKVVQSRLRH
jgi:integrase